MNIKCLNIFCRRNMLIFVLAFFQIQPISATVRSMYLLVKGDLPRKDFNLIDKEAHYTDELIFRVGEANIMYTQDKIQSINKLIPYANKTKYLNKSSSYSSPTNDFHNSLKGEPHILGPFVDLVKVYQKSGSRRFLLITFVFLLSCATLILVLLTLIGLLKKFRNRKKASRDSTCVSHTKKTSVAQASRITFRNQADGFTTPKPIKLETQASWMLSSLYKCRTTSKRKSTDTNSSIYSSASSSLSDTDTIQKQHPKHLINCTGCFNRCNNRKKPHKQIPKRTPNPRIIISPTSSCDNNQNSVENILKKVKKAPTRLSQTQLLIKFHHFSLRSPGPQSSSSLPSTSGNTAMSQRCCLSVSVVPSDKQRSKSKNRADKNAAGQKLMNDDADLSDSYSRELPAVISTETSSKLTVTPRPYIRSSTSSKEIQSQQKISNLRSKQELVSEYIQSQNSLDKISNKHTSSHASLASSVINSCSNNSNSNNGNNTNKNNNNSTNLSMSHSKSASFSSSSSSHSKQSPLNNSNEKTNKINNFPNNKVIYLKEKGSDSPLKDICLSSQIDLDQRFSVCSLVSSSPIQSIHSLDQSPCKLINYYHQSRILNDSDTATNHYCKDNTDNTDHDDTTSLTSTLTTSSTTKSTSSCSTCVTSNQAISNPLHIDVNSSTNSHNDRYKVFEPKSTLSSKCESRVSLDSTSTALSSGAEVFNLGIRLNTFRFIDDSASSTALTSPCESSSHLYTNALKPYTTNKLFHRQQQQHRFLTASNFKQTTPTPTSIPPPQSPSNNNSRNISQQSSPCSTSVCSTPEHIRKTKTTKSRPNLATQLLQQKLKKELKNFQHEQLTNDYLTSSKASSNTTFETDINQSVNEVVVVRRAYCNSTATSSSASSPVAQLPVAATKQYYKHQQQLHRKITSTSSTATPDSSSSEYENCQYVVKSRANCNRLFIQRQITTDSGDESISSIEPCHNTNNKQCSLNYDELACSATTYNKLKKPLNLNINPVTWTSSTPVMQMLASSDVYTTINQSLVDCTINEESSSENAEASSCQNEFESDTGEEDEDSTHNNNLVEDNFIRMSSPVDDDLIDLDSLADSLTKEGPEMSQLSAELCKVFEKSKISGPVLNFPNVGTSPVSEEFNNNSGDESDSREENEDEDVEDGLDALDRHSYDVNESFSDERPDYDGIILLGDEGENVESLSDVEVAERGEIEVVQKPAGIMKSSIKVLDPEGSSSSASSSPRSMVVNKEEKKAVNCAGTQKPKVRFNLDIDYEKEREWNRVNRIIGDASKSQIEWTQEVEV